ncbi:hypothetical protein PR048_032616 [Dryococelus australis]|uniref:Uncharacterized protein n=1 Tax=Dryococelus australis TaxID=614101 RepID=A0ABQ9G2Q3_9NEOP|nr:hypothetical protein PR048_032616 [Dryococelus australis]
MPAFGPYGGRGSVVVRPLTSPQGEPGSIPGGVACGNNAGRYYWSAGFLGDRKCTGQWSLAYRPRKAREVTEDSRSLLTPKTSGSRRRPKTDVAKKRSSRREDEKKDQLQCCQPGGREKERLFAAHVSPGDFICARWRNILKVELQQGSGKVGSKHGRTVPTATKSVRDTCSRYTFMAFTHFLPSIPWRNSRIPDITSQPQAMPSGKPVFTETRGKSYPLADRRQGIKRGIDRPRWCRGRSDLASWKVKQSHYWQHCNHTTHDWVTGGTFSIYYPLGYSFLLSSGNLLEKASAGLVLYVFEPEHSETCKAHLHSTRVSPMNFSWTPKVYAFALRSPVHTREPANCSLTAGCVKSQSPLPTLPRGITVSRELNICHFLEVRYGCTCTVHRGEHLGLLHYTTPAIHFMVERNEFNDVLQRLSRVCGLEGRITSLPHHLIILPTSRGAVDWCAASLWCRRFRVRIPDKARVSTRVLASSHLNVPLSWLPGANDASNPVDARGSKVISLGSDAATEMSLLYRLGTGGAHDCSHGNIRRSPRDLGDMRRTGLNPQPGKSWIFASEYRARRLSWSAGFLWDVPFPPLFRSGADPFSPALKTSLLRAAQIS